MAGGSSHVAMRCQNNAEQAVQAAIEMEACEYGYSIGGLRKGASSGQEGIVYG